MISISKSRKKNNKIFNINIHYYENKYHKTDPNKNE